MNWYKQAQQSLLFYPHGQVPDNSSEKINPVGVDPQTGQNIYNCSLCKEPILEEDIEQWYVQQGEDNEEVGTQYQLPPYDRNRVSQALTEISQYLLPFYNQLQQFIQDEDLESKRNNTYDYGYRSSLSGWEVQVPQLPNILNKYQELLDLCNYQNQGYRGYGVCGLFNTTEMNGSTLNDLSDFILNPEKEVDSFMNYAGEKFRIKHLVPVCHECSEDLETCEMCSNIIFPGETKYETTWDRGSVCESCVESGRANTCMDCGKVDSDEDMHYVEDEGHYCKDCYEKKDDEIIQWAKNKITELDIPVGKNLPLSTKVLDNLYEFLTSYMNKYGNNYLKEKECGRLNHLANKSGLTSGAKEHLEYLNKSHNEYSRVSDILDGIQNNIDAQDYMKEQYPNLSHYKDLPFDMDVEQNYSRERNGFTITISPSDEFLDYAEHKYPQIRDIWSAMRITPHHSGVLAYARCAYEQGNTLVINNLQRDADFDNYSSRTSNYNLSPEKKEAAKWFDSMTKHWDVFLLNVIKSIAIKEDISAYLTTFDQQRSKWRNLPVHKSKRSYEQVPESMGFSLNDDVGQADELLEEQTSWGEPMYQVANTIGMNWYKKAQQYEYIGDCRDTVDILDIWDATQMAQLIENSTSLDPQSVASSIDKHFGEQIISYPDNFEAGQFQSIIWIYNIETDIHYFFRK